MAAEGTAVHLANGTLHIDEAFGQAVLIGIGAIPGAQVGARLSHRIHGDHIIKALAAALILVGLRLGLKAL